MFHHFVKKYCTEFFPFLIICPGLIFKGQENLTCVCFFFSFFFFLHKGWVILTCSIECIWFNVKCRRISDAGFKNNIKNCSKVTVVAKVRGRLFCARTYPRTVWIERVVSGQWSEARKNSLTLPAGGEYTSVSQVPLDFRSYSVNSFFFKSQLNSFF